ncbi:MAG: hypothetical protein K6A68_07935 [Clostridiales bacterium]|nr:hypothetical protein [Clostridiales bacterium]
MEKEDQKEEIHRGKKHICSLGGKQEKCISIAGYSTILLIHENSHASMKHDCFQLSIFGDYGPRKIVSPAL